MLGRPFYLMGFVDGWSPMNMADRKWPEPFGSALNGEPVPGSSWLSRSWVHTFAPPAPLPGTGRPIRDDVRFGATSQPKAKAGNLRVPDHEFRLAFWQRRALDDGICDLDLRLHWNSWGSTGAARLL